MHTGIAPGREELGQSKVSGCFYSESIFAATEIRNWVDGDKTALSLYRDIDSMIGSASGLLIDKDLLPRMNEFWF